MNHFKKKLKGQKPGFLTHLYSHVKYENLDKYKKIKNILCFHRLHYLEKYITGVTSETIHNCILFTKPFNILSSQQNKEQGIQVSSENQDLCLISPFSKPSTECPFLMYYMYIVHIHSCICTMYIQYIYRIFYKGM